MSSLLSVLYHDLGYLGEQPVLPQHLSTECVDPAELARFIGEDIPEPRIQESKEDEILSAIRRIEKRLDGGTSSVEPAARMLNTKQVAELLGCSYSQARRLMQEGRLKSIKDGRLLRSRREWVEEYLVAQMVQKPEPQIAEVKVKRPKVKQVGDFKKGGIAYEFLRSRPD